MAAAIAPSFTVKLQLHINSSKWKAVMEKLTSCDPQTANEKGLPHYGTRERDRKTSSRWQRRSLPFQDRWRGLPRIGVFFWCCFQRTMGMGIVKLVRIAFLFSKPAHADHPHPLSFWKECLDPRKLIPYGTGTVWRPPEVENPANMLRKEQGGKKIFNLYFF